MLGESVPPEEILWEAEAGLFASSVVRVEPPMNLKVPAAFVDMAQSAACHRDPTRWGLLYRILWRVTRGGEKHLPGIATDPDMAKARLLEKALRREQGVPDQCQVFGSPWVAFRRTVFLPIAGVPLPMVEVFHAPMLPDHLAELGGGLAAVSVRGAEQAHRHFGLRPFLGRAIDARAFDDLRDVRKGTHLGVHRHDGDVPHFKPAMPALQLAHQIHGAAFEQLSGVFLVVSLVRLDRGKVFPAESEDQEIRFFGCAGRRR